MRLSRSVIQVSWDRSAASLVDENDPTPPFDDGHDSESLLLRAAQPVMAALSAELVNEPVCLILTDQNGRVLQREGGDSALLRALDKVCLAPGFGYGESHVGTNGIGTALEVGGPVLVHGSEHYATGLRPFSCAGALITHPTTGGLLGIFDITTASAHANPLLLTFAKLAAKRIQERILEVSTELDAALLAGYYAACQHSGGPVLAVSKNVFMMNAITEQHFDANDQAALLSQAREAIDARGALTLMADLPSGITARLAYSPTMVGETLAGGVIQVKEQQLPVPRINRTLRPLQGLAGTSAPWLHVSQELVEAISEPSWVVVDGESGAGKMALIRAAHASSTSTRRLAVVDAMDGSVDLIEEASSELELGSDLVVRRAHLLSPDQVDALASLFGEIEEDPSVGDVWIALTTNEEGVPANLGMHLLHYFPRTVRVPPLRHHIEDLAELVRVLLIQAGAPNLMLSQQAINQLMRLSWPHNVTQLGATVGTIVRSRRAGVVDMGDLPSDCLATSRRNLSRMEALERDAILEALKLNDGDRTAAAESLGMSRATIYRKIREFGISRTR